MNYYGGIMINEFDTTTTLREALNSFRNFCKDQLTHRNEDVSESAKEFFHAQDVAHVLFDCDISLFGEGCVKMWTIFGTTCGFWNHIKGYMEADAFNLSKDFTIVHVMQHIFKLLFTIPRIIIKATRMSKKWPWDNFDIYLDRPIHNLRKEFNILPIS